jgi:integrase
MAKIWQRGASWVTVVPLPRDPLTNARRQKWLTGPTKRAVERARARLLTEIAEGRHVEPATTTLREHWERWLDIYARDRVTARTLEWYADQGRQVCAVLGDVRLDRLRADQIQAFYARERARGLSPRSINHLHGRIKAVLKSAVRWGLIAKNPADGADPPRIPKRPVPVLDADQARRLAAAAVGSRSYLPILLALTAAMRRGEILALRWSDVDLAAGTLTIRHSLELTKAHGRRLKAPKSEAGNRTLCLPPVTVAALERHREEQAAHRQRMGNLYREQGFVCAGPYGDPLPENAVRDDYAKIRAALGLPPVTFHGLRHSAASLAHDGGMQLAAVSAWLGHADLTQAARTYLHPVGAAAGQGAEIMGRIVGGREGEGC